LFFFSLQIQFLAFFLPAHAGLIFCSIPHVRDQKWKSNSREDYPNCPEIKCQGELYE